MLDDHATEARSLQDSSPSVLRRCPLLVPCKLYSRWLRLRRRTRAQQHTTAANARARAHGLWMNSKGRNHHSSEKPCLPTFFIYNRHHPSLGMHDFARLGFWGPNPKPSPLLLQGLLQDGPNPWKPLLHNPPVVLWNTEDNSRDFPTRREA
jgi:hypothetical protein